MPRCGLDKWNGSHRLRILSWGLALAAAPVPTPQSPRARKRLPKVPAILDFGLPILDYRTENSKIGSRFSHALFFLPNPNRKSKIQTSFDHSVRQRHHVRRNRQANLLGSLEIDYELKLRRLLHRQIGGFGAFENLIDVCGVAPVQIGLAHSVTHNAPGFHNF